MATNLKNLSDYDTSKVPDAEKMKFGIVVSEWNSEITDNLYKGAFDTLRFFAEYGEFDAIICIGCIIKGETPHFEYICQSVTKGITDLNIKYNKPFIFCVLTTNNIDQARERAGGKYGNKGNEAAITAIKMAALNNQMRILKG